MGSGLGNRGLAFPEPYTALALMEFTLKQPRWALVEHQIFPAAVGQANSQRRLLVHREWTDDVHSRQLR